MLDQGSRIRPWQLCGKVYDPNIFNVLGQRSIGWFSESTAYTHTHTHRVEMSEHGHLQKKKKNSGSEANVYVLIEKFDQGN